MLENLDKIMHLCFNFDACPMHSSFGFVHLTHQNLSARALFCLNSLAKVNTQLLIYKYEWTSNTTCRNKWNADLLRSTHSCSTHFACCKSCCVFFFFQIFLSTAQLPTVIYWEVLLELVQVHFSSLTAKWSPNGKERLAIKFVTSFHQTNNASQKSQK